MKRLVWSIIALALLIAAALLWRPAPETDTFYEQVLVERGPVSDMLRETGVLTPRDPVVAKAPIRGTLEWIIEDEMWVDQGDRLFVVNGDEALQEVTEKRTSLLNRQQEMALARLRREHARRLEEQKVNAAQRQLELTQVRYRILSAEPQGGTRLIEIHQQLLPLERDTASIRNDYEDAQNAYQRAQDGYLESFDGWQERKDAIVRVQAKIDEYTVRSEADVDETKPQEVAARQEAVQQLSDARSEQSRLRDGLAELKKARDQARAAATAARGPRDDLLAKLAQREVAEKELYVQLEIEKRGVALTQLRLDHQAAQLSLAEAKRKQAEGQAAFDSGAISQAYFEDLESKVLAAGKELDILDKKVEIAARPVPREVLTEARLEMEKAEATAHDVRSVRDRNLATLDKEIELLEAQIARSMHDIAQLTKGFPTVIEFNIEFLEKELEALEEGEEVRRGEIEKELIDLAADLERVRADPPNVGKSAAAGVVRLNSRWGRVYHVGDRVNAEDIIMEIFPASNLEVRAAVNEANVRHVRPGMPVRMTVPALAERKLSGSIILIGGVGKDKFAGIGGWNSAAFAGVTQFEARVSLDDVSDDLRPGMTVVLEITMKQEEDVLYLPRGAVRVTDGSAVALTGSADAPHQQSITGRTFGDDLFLVDSGLRQGDVVLIERKRSR